jgi:antitoxin MazE
VRAENGRIIIEPVRQKLYRLEDLVKGITPENLPHWVDFGPRAGREIW